MKKRIVAVVCLVVTAGALLGCRKAAPIAAPTKYVPFEAIDKSFKGVAPEGWKVQRAGLQGTVASAKILFQDAEIRIVSDLQGSLMGDVMTASNNQLDALTGALPATMRPAGGATKPPVERLHAAGQKKASADLENYAEQPMQTVQTQLGDGRYSEFTATNIHGYRVTILGGERLVTVVAKCPESDWTALKPAFTKVITTIQQGSN